MAAETDPAAGSGRAADPERAIDPDRARVPDRAADPDRAPVPDRTDGPGAPSAPVPQATEHVHLPGPSYLPVLLAFGVALALVGVVISWIVFGLGMVIVLVAAIRWIRETRQSIAELPLEH